MLIDTRPRGDSADDGKPRREPRVLIVDDEPSIGMALSRLLESDGFSCVVAGGSDEAMEAITSNRFSVVLSDVHMPGASGVDLLRAIRSHDLDVPVILMTGGPDIASAIQAVELGALQYLCKPFENVALVGAVRRAAQLHELALLKREALELLGVDATAAADRATLGSDLDRALASMSVALQPIVRVSEQHIIAHEVLMRSAEPRLATPLAVLDAAERLQRVHELGRVVRGLAAKVLARLPDECLLFVNLHPQDLLDPDLAHRDSILVQHAERIVLEITERASLDDVPEAQARVNLLRTLGFRFALDNLGAGHAGLGGFAKCQPEFVKLDMSLARDIHHSPARQRLVRGLSSLAVEMGSVVIAEGIELAAERDTMTELGCDLMQGYFFAKPAAEPPSVRWT